MRHRYGIGIALACLLGWALAACGPESDGGGEAPPPMGVEQETPEADTAWAEFRSRADRELQAMAEDLERARAELQDVERAEVDRWAERVQGARQELAKEMADAPEARKQEREAMRSELEEIRQGVAALFAKLEPGRSAAGEGEPRG